MGKIKITEKHLKMLKFLSEPHHRVREIYFGQSRFRRTVEFFCPIVINGFNTCHCWYPHDLPSWDALKRRHWVEVVFIHPRTGDTTYRITEAGRAALKNGLS